MDPVPTEPSADVVSVDAELVGERVAALRALVERHATAPVRIVAVTKRFGPDAVQAALAAGLSDMGENYAQELAGKAAALAGTGAADAIRWHFIGHLQRNKVRTVADVVHVWQTVDSVRLGHEIAVRAPGARVLVQVNASGATSQGGVAAADVPSLVEALRAEDLRVEGLMTIGAQADADRSRVLFAEVRRLADLLELPECSMGMTDDLVPALESGSTMVRVGTALFGPRPAP